MPAAALENCVITEQNKNFGGEGGSVVFTPICPNCGKRNESIHYWLRDGDTKKDQVGCEQCNETFTWSVAWM